MDGKEIFLGPKESMHIQGALGADIIFAFDECPPPVAGYEYMKQSVERTHRWAEICLREKKTVGFPLVNVGEDVNNFSVLLI